jgi:hypothetical protein
VPSVTVAQEELVRAIQGTLEHGLRPEKLLPHFIGRAGTEVELKALIDYLASTSGLADVGHGVGLAETGQKTSLADGTHKMNLGDGAPKAGGTNKTGLADGTRKTELLGLILASPAFQRY